MSRQNRGVRKDLRPHDRHPTNNHVKFQRNTSISLPSCNPASHSTATKNSCDAGRSGPVQQEDCTQGAPSKAFTVPLTPVSITNQASPSHCAVWLTRTPPAVENAPPATRRPPKLAIARTLSVISPTPLPRGVHCAAVAFQQTTLRLFAVPPCSLYAAATRSPFHSVKAVTNANSAGRPLSSAAQVAPSHCAITSAASPSALAKRPPATSTFAVDYQGSYPAAAP